MGENVPRKGEEEGWPEKGAKGEKGRVKTGQNMACSILCVPVRVLFHRVCSCECVRACMRARVRACVTMRHVDASRCVTMDKSFVFEIGREKC